MLRYLKHVKHRLAHRFGWNTLRIYDGYARCTGCNWAQKLPSFDELWGNLVCSDPLEELQRWQREHR